MTTPRPGDVPGRDRQKLNIGRVFGLLVCGQRRPAGRFRGQLFVPERAHREVLQASKIEVILKVRPSGVLDTQSSSRGWEAFFVNI